MKIFVARQPIFDDAGRLFGYELLYRRSAEAADAEIDDENVDRSHQVVVDAVLGIGLRRLTEGLPAFVNLDREMLLAGSAELLDSRDVVLELLESVEPDPEVVSAARALAEAGYRIALDDFEMRQGAGELLEIAEIVKVDILAYSEDGLNEAVQDLAGHDVLLLAEKVESSEQHARCVDLGFRYFQGFHYLRPEVVTRSDLPTASVTILRLMNLLRDMSVPDSTIEEMFRGDLGLSYKLLRMVNSAALGGRGIESLAHAVRLLGREPLYRWVSLLLVSAHGRSGHLEGEIVKSSLLRGRLAELIGRLLGLERNGTFPTPGSLFIAGLFSRLDILLSMPMEDILDRVDLTDDVEEALLRRTGVGGRVLNAVDAYEAGEWARAEEEIWELGGDFEALPDLYMDALIWARQRVDSYEG